jgi:serine/threonine protein kinase/Tfp pilus assembly protein PilF
MTPERYRHIEELYHAALEHSPAERMAFLDQACGRDESLRKEVESLLAYDERAESFIESPPDDLVALMLADTKAGSMAGQTLGRYQLHSLIGSGGMGEVYRAADTRLDREVAVKILPEHLATDLEALRRFEREAKAVAALSHPNILAIYDFGTEQGVSYAVMELLEGESLRGCLQRGVLEWRRAVEIGIAVAEGLAAAHARGIIHRDLKPENIFLTADGQVKILDFGIAKLKRTVAGESEIREPTVSDAAVTDTTRPGVIMGTVGYMSPEQVRGEAVEGPSDLFSLGGVLYEMVSGVRPFVRKTRAETIAALLKDEPPALAGTGKDVPAEMERLIRRCLEKSVENRYQSARDVAVDLKALVRGTGHSKASDQPDRRLRLPALLAGVILIGLIGGTGYWWRSARAKRREAAAEVKSIAVLPFRSLRPDEDKEYLGLGLADTVITKLSSLQSLIVRPTSAVLKYSSPTQDPLTAGREQGVDAVLDASLQQHDDRVRVSLRLLRVSDEKTLWTYQCEEVLCNNIFAMQDVISEQVGAALIPHLTGEERERLRKRFTENKEAYQSYANGLHFLSTGTGDGARKASEEFKQAVDKDANYALAYVGWANSYTGLVQNNLCRPKECFPKAKALALKALDIDDGLAEAHASLGQILHFYDWDWAGAKQHFTRAMDLNPGYAFGHQWYGTYLITLGHFDEAKEKIKLSLKLDPVSIVNYDQYAAIFYYAREYDQAIALLRKTLELDPTWSFAHRRLGQIYELKGMYDQAVAEYLIQSTALGATPEMLASFKDAYVKGGMRSFWQMHADLAHDLKPGASKFLRARAYAAIGEKEEVIRWLQQAYADREGGMVVLKVDPLLDGVRSDPRFIEMMRGIGFPP